MPKETDRSHRRFAIRVIDGFSDREHDIRIPAMRFGTHVAANEAAQTMALTCPDNVPREARRAR